MIETTRGEFQEAEEAKVSEIKDGTHGCGSFGVSFGVK